MKLLLFTLYAHLVCVAALSAQQGAPWGNGAAPGPLSASLLTLMPVLLLVLLNALLHGRLV